MAKVDIGVACSGFQTPEWWTNLCNELLGTQKLGVEIGSMLTISSALPDHNKNNILTSSPWNPEEKRRAQLTDANRVEMAKRFLDGDADWLYTIDDDTKHPPGTLHHMMSLRRDAVAGLYFNPKPPHNPLAYIRHESGLYHAYYGYAKGTLQQVDSVGMGCTLIHRSVFEKIREAYRVFQRPNGSLVAIHKDDIKSEKKSFVRPKYPVVVNNILHTPLKELDDAEVDNRAFPFFAMEYGRTEDHHFWELAERVGVKPWLDTTIVCDHIKSRAVNESHYLKFIEERYEDGELHPRG